MISRLRETIAGLHARGSARSPEATILLDADGHDGDGHPTAACTLQASLPLDSHAPGAARSLAENLGGLVAASVVDDVQLVVSELVTNSVRHSGASADGCVEVSIELMDTAVHVQVTDRGSNGVFAPRFPDQERTGGFGLSIVREVAERWGLEQGAPEGTRVWAQLTRPALTAAADSSGAEAI